MYWYSNVLSMQSAKQMSSDGFKGIESKRNSRELVNALIQMGVSTNTARCLVCLSMHGPSTSRQLQENCGIRQPDVSVAAAELKRLNLIELDSRASPGRGRPSHVYQLTCDLASCIQPFLEEAEQKIERMRAGIDNIVKLTDILS